jgi:hypothetical protein
VSGETPSTLGWENDTVGVEIPNRKPVGTEVIVSPMLGALPELGGAYVGLCPTYELPKTGAATWAVKQYPSRNNLAIE